MVSIPGGRPNRSGRAVIPGVEYDMERPKSTVSFENEC